MSPASFSMVATLLSKRNFTGFTLNSQGIYVIAWKSVSCTHMEMSFFGKIDNCLFSIMWVHDYSECKYIDTHHAITWTNSCNGMTHGVMQVNKCPNWIHTWYFFLVVWTFAFPWPYMNIISVKYTLNNEQIKRELSMLRLLILIKWFFSPNFMKLLQKIGTLVLSSFFICSLFLVLSTTVILVTRPTSKKRLIKEV